MEQVGQISGHLQIGACLEIKRHNKQKQLVCSNFKGGSRFIGKNILTTGQLTNMLSCVEQRAFALWEDYVKTNTVA